LLHLEFVKIPSEVMGIWNTVFSTLLPKASWLEESDSLEEPRPLNQSRIKWLASSFLSIDELYIVINFTMGLDH
jgi:hypothetical protein